MHELLLEILNTELGTFLTKWHPLLKAWDEAEAGDESMWPQNALFRTELRELQLHLRPYLGGLGEIAGLRDPEGLLPRLEPAADRGLPPQRASEADRAG